MKKTLQDKPIARITEHLTGTCGKRDTSAWAVRVLRKTTFRPDEARLEDTITALAGLHDQDERWDTVREDLIDYQERLGQDSTHSASERANVPAIAEEQESYK
ncbi:MAG: hypothetical protein PVH17_08640 [Anaerolineae bacterium]|jgi:hypothetical protein